VFFAVGFETTAPANAMAAYQARSEGLKNFSLLVSHVLVPPAMEAILGSSANRVQGFLAAGHVCVVMGCSEYEPIARKYRVPIVVTGFEPLDILQGVLMCVQQLESGRAEVENQYARAVRPEGNVPAQRVIREVFTVIPRKWRGVGQIPQSGLGLSPQFAAFDAEQRFGVAAYTAEESPECRSGLVLQGVLKPHECPAFGRSCTPEHPLGATMVSTEGACSAYYRYRRNPADSIDHG
jgi:hydrogenase expression/formation protein HypD